MRIARFMRMTIFSGRNRNRKSILRPSFRRSAGWIPFIFPFLFPVVTSCVTDSPVIYSHFESVGHDGIPTDRAYVFFPEPFDSIESATGKFDVVIVLRYSNRCTAENVLLDIEQFSLVQTTPDSSRMTMPLFSRKGQPLGDGGGLTLYEVSDTLAHGRSIPDGYMVSVSSPVSANSTKGVTDIGVKLIRTGEREFDIHSLLNL